jgi:hypothetical protein
MGAIPAVRATGRRAEAPDEVAVPEDVAARGGRTSAEGVMCTGTAAVAVEDEDAVEAAAM